MLLKPGHMMKTQYYYAENIIHGLALQTASFIHRFALVQISDGELDVQ